MPASPTGVNPSVETTEDGSPVVVRCLNMTSARDAFLAIYPEWSANRKLSRSAFRGIPRLMSSTPTASPNNFLARDASAVGNGKQRKTRSADRKPTTIAGDPFYREWLCGAGQGCRGRILERLYIDNCSPLTVELFRQLAFFILSCKPISYCGFKRIDVYILYSFKPNAISGHARLA